MSTPIIKPGSTYASVSDKIAEIVLEEKLGRKWYLGLALSLLGTFIFLYAITWLFIFGVGVWGNNVPIAWAFDITNFVWWIGIGHAGTFISAILLLLRQKWRTSINRFAEAMTLIAVLCAGMFPLIHLGRPWFFFWLFPYPNNQQVWPQFRSPLMWDVFAVLTYAFVSFIFWFIGLIPDLAVLRDKATTKQGKIIYGILAMGWRGSARHWQRYEKSYFLLAALAAPLVVSVHTIVSLDFAVSIIPGWHSTIFPPYFVAGAIYSGFAMVLSLAIPLRYFYKLEDFITIRHFENSAKILLAMGMFVAYGYLMEAFMSWWSGDIFERYIAFNRISGPYAFVYWSLIVANVIVPQVLWFKKIRKNLKALFILSVIINIGMWLERFMIIVTSLHRDFLPSSWGMYYPTRWDFLTLIGSISLFFLLFLIFIRLLPMISISEMQKLVDEEKS
ncbi:MAG: polysulfide reductase NrfD [Bacteriovorax sp.]|nr:polysulfide reductase NrfD [Bacteriovorax sp.]